MLNKTKNLLNAIHLVITYYKRWRRKLKRLDIKKPSSRDGFKLITEFYLLFVFHIFLTFRPFRRKLYILFINKI